jgi:hypothetical protein
MTREIAEHCGFTAFAFVPNICNAACSFCYVHPSLAANARASHAVLERAAVAAEVLSALGFEEVRFTGGEPTLFSNLDELIQPFLEQGLKYRVLTNAIKIADHLPFFRESPPVRFTISVHDTVHPEDVFDVAIDADSWESNRRQLAQICDVEATLVIQDPMLGRLRAHRALEDLASDGVAHIKLILENSQQVSATSSFNDLACVLRDTWGTLFQSFRYTDTKQCSCRLKDKGFPSIDLGSSTIFACCVQVGDRTIPAGHSSSLPITAGAAIDTFVAVIENSRGWTTPNLPCDAGHSFCPLGLAK